MNQHLAFKISVISPEETLFTGDVTMVTIPGSEGEFSVLAGHVNFISTITEGVISIYQHDKLEKTFAVKKGVVEVNQQACIILIREFEAK